jgi:hypothetical protein
VSLVSLSSLNESEAEDRCHVLAHESFENEEIAKIMNEYFVNIKVDREERPDVDRMYMTFLQVWLQYPYQAADLLLGHLGWGRMANVDM